jgi:polysaccharide export outer membrane protein
MKTAINKAAYASKILLGVSSMFLCSGLVYAQNFALINQKPAQEQDDQADSAKSSVTATKAYTKAQTYIANEQVNSKYTLGTNDVLTITVQRHPEVSGKYTINTEGKIQFEFVGDITLTGMTKEQAAVVITQRLEKYIINPDVTVVITEYNSKVVYVVGEVGAPGKIYMRGDTISVRDALLAANLPQLTAATDSATLFTPADNGKVVLKKVNVYALLYMGDLRQNYVMKPGDTLYLPATLWAKVARFINPVTQPLGSAAGAAASVHAI